MLRRSLRFIRAGWIATLLVLLASSAPSWASTYNLSYDELGRLVGVVDSGGNTAAYNYDALGNIVSIVRGSGAVSIVSFSPQSGPVGANVTISGYGFSATAGQNSVAFNGTAATVVSATTSQLVVTVPAGATNGPISVASPAGSATSTSSFSVVSGQTPTITSFSPTIGSPGTPVTVTGTNFQTVAGENNLTLNGRSARVTAATVTTLGLTVPTLSSSGRFTVTTFYGQATNNQDFFVTPGTHVPADVGVTGRMTIGSAQTVTLGTSHQIGMILFDGTTGQRTSVQVSSSSFATCSAGVIQILNTDGSVAGSANLCNGSFVAPVTLPKTASYTILVSPYGTDTGSVSFTLSNVPPDPTATITVGGSSVTLGTTTAGQKMKLFFSGTAGQRVSLLTTSSNFPNCYWGTVALIKPDGTQLTASNLCSGAYIDALILPATGTYTIAVNPTGTDIGTGTFTLYSVPPDPSATITIGGPSVTLGTTTPGQNMSLTFSGTAGQRVSLLTTNSSFTNCYWGTVALIKPDGTQLTNSNLCSGAYIDALILPATGTYTIAVNPSGADIGTATFTLYSVPPDPSATITIGGPSVTLGTTTPGQNMSLTFSGTAGQSVSLLTTNSSFPNCYWGTVALIKPDGTQLASSNLCSNAAINMISLPLTGTYTIAVNPSGSDTGSATFTLSGQ
jgi:YD repeat-containing protein